MGVLKKASFLPLMVSWLLAGCVSTPAVRMDGPESLKRYGAFEAAPVSNGTGKTFDFDVADELSRQIRLQLESKGFVVAAASAATDNVLVIKSVITAYEPGSALKRWLAPGAAGKTQATVVTSLVDKGTGAVVGEMVNAEGVGGGGLFSAGADRWILEAIAKGIANEIEARMK